MQKKAIQYVVALTTGAVTLAVYLAALKNRFVLWDDDLFIISNVHIRSLNPDMLKWAFTDLATTGNWHPLTWISYAVDYALWGLDPRGYHLSGILLHAANTIAVVLLTAKLTALARASLLLPAQSATAEGGLSISGSRYVLVTAGVAGLLFGLHPLHVETAVWAADRRDLLCTLFYLLSMVYYLNFASARRNMAGPFMPDRNYLLALVFMIAAGASKSMAVTLPLVFLLLDWYPLGRARSFSDARKLVLEKAPFLAVSLALSLAAYVAQSAYKAVVPVSVLPYDVRVPVVFRSLVLYLRNMALPTDLLPFYPYPQGASFKSGEYLAMTALVCGLTALCLAAAKRQKLYLAVWAWFLVTLVPVIGIVQIGSHSMADRYVYLPSAGFCLLAGAGAASAWSRAYAPGKWSSLVKMLGPVVLVFVVVVLSYLTLQQIGLWQNTINLWSAVIEKEPGRVPVAYSGRGLAFSEQGNYEAALADLTTAISLEPRNARFYTNRGSVYGAAGRRALAMNDFTAAIALDPDFALPYVNRGLLYEEADQLDRALADLTTAIGLSPDNSTAYLNRGLTLERMGRFAQAIEDYGRAIALDPLDYLALCYRGIVFAGTGETEKAFADYGRVLSLKPDYADGYIYRGNLFMKTGSPESGLRDYQRACELGSGPACKAAEARAVR